MILSDLLGTTVVDDAGQRLGRVADVRFRLDARSTPATPRVVGIIVSPRFATSFLGYERTAASGPALINAILRRMHQGSFLVEWRDIGRIDDDAVKLRAGFERKPSAL